MKNTWIDQSSIYGQRYNKFYRWVLYPILFLLIIVSLFLSMAKKEVVIKTEAQITTETDKLQIPVNAKVKQSRLHENKKVKKGEPLIEFDTTDLLNEKLQIVKNNNDLEQQKKAGQLFIDSLSQNKNLFINEDSYGYSNQLNSILSENSASNYSLKQNIEANKEDKKNYIDRQNEFAKQITSRQNNQKNLREIRLAWNNEQNISGYPNELQSKYQSWQMQLLNVSEEQKNQIKSSILAEIDDQINQSQKEIEGIELDKLNLEMPDNLDNDIKSEEEKENQLKEQSIATTKEKISELSSNEEKNKLSIKSIEKQIDLGTLVSPITGILHVENSIKGQKILPKGTVVGEIYPRSDKNKIEFTALLPANEMTRVKEGMKVHFKLDKKGVAPVVMEGSLSEISESSTETKQGSFFEVKGKLIPKKNIETRYGLTGELSFIIGKKTYWEQIKEVLTA